MKRHFTFIPIMNEVPSNMENKSLNMLLRAGFIRRSTSGIYTYLPLAKKIISKLEAMVRKEMEQNHGIEVMFPTLQIAKDNEHLDHRFLLKDHNHQPFLLSANHFESVLTFIRDEINYCNKFPLLFYQIDKAFRDVPTIHHNFINSREFNLSEAYSFHETNESLQQVYHQITQSFTSILSKLGLRYQIVKGNSEIQQYDSAEEIMILSDMGEDVIAFSNESDYAANIEVAKVVFDDKPSLETMKALKKIETKDINSIEELCREFSIDSIHCIKSFLYNIDGELCIVLVRGDHQLNETKLKHVLQATSVTLANEEEVHQLLNCSMNFVGPVKLPIDVKVIADYAIQNLHNGVAGANENNFHYIHVNPERDFAINLYADIRYIQEGDLSPDGHGNIELTKAMKLGCFYKWDASAVEKMNDITVHGEPLLIGGYFLNITRLFAILADQYRDASGFNWPTNVAPYHIYLIVNNIYDEDQMNLADELYNILSFYRFDVLYDNRDESAAVKAVDADLIGLPIRVTVGERAKDGIVEVKYRKSGEMIEYAKEELADRLNEYLHIR